MNEGDRLVLVGMLMATRRSLDAALDMLLAQHGEGCKHENTVQVMGEEHPLCVDCGEMVAGPVR